MLIKINKYVLKTYSTDLLCVQKGNDTLSSSFDIRTSLNYLVRNGFEELKNRVEEIFIDYSTYELPSMEISFETKNYSITKDSKTEFAVQDKSSRNNCRWIKKVNLLNKLYLLEINRLDASSVDELVAQIIELNQQFKTMIKEIK